MTGDQNDDGATTEADDRLWIEILSWDWNLAVAISSKLTPKEHRFQGGLNYVRAFELSGRVVAPHAHCGRTIRIWISPFGADMRFGRDEMDEVGRLYLSPTSSDKADWTARLMLPADAVAALATCLGAVSKYVFISIFDGRDEEASIDHYAFSSTLPDGAEATSPRENC